MTIREGMSHFVGKILSMPTVEITQVERISPNFLMVTFRGDGIKNCQWNPGDKIQINLNLNFRTYTPLYWDQDKGESKFLSYLHSPTTMAGEWLQSLKSGDVFQFYGPRKSFNINSFSNSISDSNSASIFFFGDETSFGTAYALRPKGNIRFFFETSHLEESRKVLQYLGLSDSTLVLKQKDSIEVELRKKLEVEEKVKQVVFIMTGHGSSIQHLRKLLREEKIPIPMKRLKTKVYWADGKKGLD